MTAISPDRVESATPIQRGIREALYAGAISFGLFFLLIGVKTDQNIRNELILVPALGPARHRGRRWSWSGAS